MNKTALIVLVMYLNACSNSEKIVPMVDGSPASIAVDISAIADAIPRYEPWPASVNPKSYVVLGKTYQVLPSNKGYRQQGIASWYGTKFHQKKTATGEIYDMWAMSAAHKTLPIPSYVRVTNLHNQRSVVVRVNDRGPFHADRIIDLSFSAATKLDLVKAGTGLVEVVAVQASNNKMQYDVFQANKIYYQVGAFTTQEKAVLLQEKMAVATLLESRVVLRNKLFKVQLGPIYSVTEANHISVKLKDLGIENGHYIYE